MLDYQQLKMTNQGLKKKIVDYLFRKIFQTCEGGMSIPAPLGVWQVSQKPNEKLRIQIDI